MTGVQTCALPICTISAPTITPVSGYTGNGFGTTNTATSATVAASGTITLSNSSNGGTYYGLQKKTVTITYNGNGATGGSTASQNCSMYNANTICAITLNSNGFTRPNYNFQGYGTGTTSVTHNVGTSYNFSNNTTLYAIWKVSVNLDENRTFCTKEANESAAKTMNNCMNGGGTESQCLSAGRETYSYAYNMCCNQYGGCS